MEGREAQVPSRPIKTRRRGAQTARNGEFMNNFEMTPEVFQRCKAAFIEEWMNESRTINGLPTDIGGWFAHYDVRCVSDARIAGRKVAQLNKSA